MEIWALYYPKNLAKFHFPLEWHYLVNIILAKNYWKPTGCHKNMSEVVVGTVHPNEIAQQAYNISLISDFYFWMTEPLSCTHLFYCSCLLNVSCTHNGWWHLMQYGGIWIGKQYDTIPRCPGCFVAWLQATRDPKYPAVRRYHILRALLYSQCK